MLRTDPKKLLYRLNAFETNPDEVLIEYNLNLAEVYNTFLVKRALSIFLSGIFALFSLGIKSQTYTFTSAGATGRFGPTQTQLNTSYSLTNLSGLVTTTNGIQSFTVPTAGPYRIEARGAKGGNGLTPNGGPGAIIRGDFTLTAGLVIKILVGQVGGNGDQGGGGGASFVVTNTNAPLCIAGGGGGAANLFSTGFGAINSQGTIALTGQPGINGNASVTAGPGGSLGAGGGTTTTFSAGVGSGGGGLNGNGVNGNPSTGGLAFLNGATGGLGSSGTFGSAGNGGFGGGGGGDWFANGGGGGGGGYSGGGGGVFYGWGGGGGSFNAGVNQLNSSGTNSTSGLVIITKLSGITIAQTSSISCNSQLSAALSATAFGGTGPYTYTWLPVNLTGSVVSSLAAGTYTCLATDANMTSFSNTFLISQPPALALSILSQTNVSCFGGSNGAITTTASGGTGSYTYTWSPSGGNNSGTTGRAAGIYTLTIKDQSNCTAALNTTITQPAPLVVSGFATSPSVCLGGTSILLGAGAISYTWSHGIVNGVTFSPTVTSNYTVTGTNAQGCTASTVVPVTVNPLPSISISGSSTVCAGASITLTASGASSYLWSVNASSSGSANVTLSPTLTTTYSVTGTTNGCQGTAFKTVTVSGLPVLSINTPSVSVCAGNLLTLSGGGAISYTWSGGITNAVAFTPTASATYTLSGSNTCGTSTAIASVSVNPLPTVSAFALNPVVCAGGTTALQGSGAQTYLWTGGITNNSAFVPTSSTTYFVIGTDANGCQNSASASVTVNPLPSVTANASSTLICLGNTVSLSGAGAITYTWSGSVTNNSAFSPTATSGYTVSGTNVNGCVNTAAITVSVSNVPLVSATSSGPSVCIGGTTSVSGIGATSYSWSGGISNTIAFSPTVTSTYTVSGINVCGSSTAAITITVNTLPVVFGIASPPVICAGNTLVLLGGGASTYSWTSGVVNNLPFSPSSSNTYTLTGTDANGCKNTATVSTVVNPLPVITVIPGNTAVCIGNAITLNASGANTFTWSGGISNGVAFTPTATSAYSVSGTNTVTGCAAVNAVIRTVTVNNLPLVTANASATQICIGSQVTLTGSGASTYTWSGGVTNNSAFVPTLTSTYTVNGTNTLTGCTGTNNAQITVSVNARPSVSLNVSNPVICLGNTTALNASGANTFTISATVINGIPFTPSVTTTYSLTGTNTLTGCSSTNTALQTITVNPLPALAIMASNTAVCVGNTVSLSVSGANTYVWSGGIVNGMPFTPTTTASYSVIGTNTLTGCTKTATQLITVNPLPTLTASSNTAVCIGGSVTLSASGASSYTWSGGVINSVPFTPSVSANYSVSGTNTLTGCNTASTVVVSVTVHPLPTFLTNASSNVVCLGNSVTLLAGGISTYSWSGGVINNVPFQPTATAVYTCTGTNLATGCSNISTQTIVVIPVPVVTASASSASVCVGSTVALTASGTNAYSWTNGVTNGVPFILLSTQVYTVTGTSSLTGCSSSLLYTITAFALPTLTITASNASVCLGNSVSLTASGAHTYSWTGGIFNGIPFNPTTSQSYTVTGTNTTTGCSNKATRVLSVLPAPVLTLAASNPSVCSGSTVSILASGANTYSWSGGINNGLAFTPMATQTYSVFGTNTITGCTSINPALITVSVLPLPTVSILLGNSSTCVDETYVLTATGAVTYSWNNGSPTQQIYETPLIAGAFSHVVVGEDINGCLNTASHTQTVLECTSLQRSNLPELEIQIYPNPSYGEFFVKTVSELTLYIYNETGALVRVVKVDQSEKVLISNLAAGMYFVTAKTGHQAFRKKVIIQR